MCVESEQSFTGPWQPIEEEEREVLGIAKFPKHLLSSPGAKLHPQPEQNWMEAARTRPVSAPDAPRLCSKTSNRVSSRSSRARNPWALNLRTELAAACGDDVPARCKSPPRSSLPRIQAGPHRPAARTKVLPPTSKATRPSSGSVSVLGCSPGLHTTPIIRHLDAPLCS